MYDINKKKNIQADIYENARHASETPKQISTVTLPLSNRIMRSTDISFCVNYIE